MICFFYCVYHITKVKFIFKSREICFFVLFLFNFNYK
jgi:hypothetical protein